MIGNGKRNADNAGNAGNVHLDSGESLRRFRRMLSSQHSEECSRGYREMFGKIQGNVCEILLVFYDILQLNCYKTVGKKY